MIIVGGTFAWEVIGTTCDMVFFGARIQLPLESRMYFVGLRYEHGSEELLA
jgi:hypothetical protein